MLANKSIQYMKRMVISESGKAPTVLELMTFLDRLIMSQQGNFKVIGLNLSMTIKELRYSLELFKEFNQDGIMFLIPDQIEITHYYINGHNSTLLLN